MSHALALRRHSRHAVSLEGECRNPSGSAAMVELTDISRGGCQINLRAGKIEADRVVVVRPKALEGLTGIVRWISHQAAGIQFANPLVPAVVDNLTDAGEAPARGVTVGPETRLVFTDKFGRLLPELDGRRRRRGD